LDKPDAATYAQVYRWLIKRGYETSTFNKEPEMPWEEYYIFGQKVL
jgi:hypothetical protein